MAECSVLNVNISLRIKMGSDRTRIIMRQSEDMVLFNAEINASTKFISELEKT
jgi:hypothetical protein